MKILIVFAAVFIIGCGSSPTSNNGSPVIITQPKSDTIEINQLAIFTVVAAGTGPLSYQ